MDPVKFDLFKALCRQSEQAKSHLDNAMCLGMFRVNIDTRPPNEEVDKNRHILSKITDNKVLW